MRSLAAPVVAAVVVLAHAGAGAAGPFSPDDPDALHGDVLFGMTVPLGPDAYSGSASIGGRIAPRLYLGSLEAMLDLALFSGERDGNGEHLAYRGRAMVGYRHLRELDGPRGLLLRAGGGVELGGFNGQGSGWFADAHRPGLAIELGAESRNVFDWGVVSLWIALGASWQPFGDADADESNYAGVDLSVGLGFGR